MNIYQTIAAAALLTTLAIAAHAECEHHEASRRDANNLMYHGDIQAAERARAAEQRALDKTYIECQQSEQAHLAREREAQIAREAREQARQAAEEDSARRAEMDRLDRERQEAERKKAKQEAAQRDAELSAKRAAEQQEQERIDRLPINRLLNAYRMFAYARLCNEVRQGYLVTYVNDIELERARNAIRAIAAQIKKEDSSINTDDTWHQALKQLPPVNDAMCHYVVVQLLNMSPKATFVFEKPN
jgi:hypothetical protein